MSTVLLFLLILACPLMMIFMMRGHGGHDHGGHDQTAGANRQRDGEHGHVHDEYCRHDERIAARKHEERAGVGA